MKYLLWVGLILMVLVSNAQAGVVFYEKDDFKVSLEDLTGCVLFDFKESNVLAGGKTSLVQYKEFNFDVGIIGEYDRLNELDAFVGLSYDIKATKLSSVPGVDKALNFVFRGKEQAVLDNLYTDIGLFGSPGWFDNGPKRYGIQCGLTYKF